MGGLADILSLGGGLLNLGGGGNGGFSGSQVPYNRNLVITDGDAAYNTEAEIVAIIGALAAGSVYTKIWEMTVPAQQQYRWGYGSPNQPHNQGYMYFVSVDEGTNFQTGVLRLVQANARETRVLTVKEIDDTRLHLVDSTTAESATPVNLNEMIALPEQTRFPKVGEDSLLQLFYRCIVVATTEDAAAFSIPATIYQ